MSGERYTYTGPLYTYTWRRAGRNLDLAGRESRLTTLESEVSGRRAKAHRKAADRNRDGSVHLDPSLKENALLRYFLRPPWTVDPKDIEFALRVVQLSGLLTFFGPRLAKATGRQRRTCTLEGLLVAMTVHICILGREPLLSQVSRTLHECIPLEWREHFRSNYITPTKPGCRPPKTRKEWVRASLQDRDNAYQSLRRLWKAMRLEVDSHPWPGGHRLTQAELDALVPLPKEEREEKDVLLEYVVNRLLDASVQIARETIPLEKVLPLTATDATFVPSNAHKATEHLAPIDLDITTYKRSKHIAPSRPNTTSKGVPLARRDSPPQRREKYDQGWDLHVTSLAPDPFSNYRDDPELALSMTFTGCGWDPTGNGIRTLEMAVASGLTPGILAFDTAYVTEPYLARAKELGFEVIFDPRASMADKIKDDQGALVTNGSAFCPGTPSALLSINDDYNLHLIDKRTRRIRVEEREKFELRVTQYLPDGKLRMACPALAPSGRNARVICPIKSNVYKNPKGLTVVENPPEFPDMEGVCGCPAIVVDPKDHPSWQAFTHQDPEWRAYFRSLRNGVERHNSEVKAGYAEALAVADNRGLRGRANNALLVGFLLVAHNIRVVKSWVDKAVTDADGIIVRAPRKNRRGNRVPWHLLSDEQLAALDVEPLGELEPEEPEPPADEGPAPPLIVFS